MALMDECLGRRKSPDFMARQNTLMGDKQFSKSFKEKRVIKKKLTFKESDDHNDHKPCNTCNNISALFPAFKRLVNLKDITEFMVGV